MTDVELLLRLYDLSKDNRFIEISTIKTIAGPNFEVLFFRLTNFGLLDNRSRSDLVFLTEAGKIRAEDFKKHQRPTIKDSVEI
jgi:hypothetical protein